METPLLGRTTTFKTPSKFEVTIREQDGGDDDIISKVKDATDGSAINKFVSGLILNCSITPNNGKPSPNDVLKWKLRDKYYVMYKSRIFSLGADLFYYHECSNPECKQKSPYEEDLSIYDNDFDNPVEEGSEYRVLPYSDGDKLKAEFTTRNGFQIRYNYLNGLAEKKLLKINKDEISKNTELLIRDIEWCRDEKWQPLQNFKVIPALDMQDIRTHVKKNDTPFEAISECICPYCKTVDKISLLSLPDFFFPQETL